VPAAAGLGFIVPAVFAGLLRLPRELYLLPYVLLIGALLYGNALWSVIDFGKSLLRHWPWGIAAGALAGFFGSRTVLMQPASPAPGGLELLSSLAWLGVVYGVVDALFLSVLPLSTVWFGLSGLGWTRRWPGRVAVSALAASLLLIGVYHLGYPEFRGLQVLLVVAGVGVQSLLTLITGSPIAVVVGHVAMHITAVLYGFSSVSQLPPHY
jgi:hypothetical protein